MSNTVYVANMMEPRFMDAVAKGAEIELVLAEIELVLKELADV